MVPDENLVANHYTHGSLLDAIATGLEKLGRSPETAAVDDLAPVDGGRVATEHFLDQLGISSGDHVLDVGCGLGGASRFSAERYGCRVTGIDLTREYPYPEAAFDRAYMLHVGMNIADKHALASELHRVLKPGGTLGIYDVMRVGDGDLEFPLPWAGSPEGSSVARPDEYKQALDEVGFRVTMERDRAGFAQQFFAELQARAATAAGPPPLGLHILMGETAPTKIGNMVENISRGRVAPVELIGEKPVQAA
jgi:SAM-dependent methyltransferase